MKKTDFNSFNAYATPVADGLEFDEVQKLNKSAARMRKVEKNRAWLQAQEAELSALTMDHLLDTFDAVPENLNAHLRTLRTLQKADLHQVLTLSREDYDFSS